MSTSTLELMTEYTKAIFNSSQMAAEDKLKALRADKTIIGVVVDDTDWENGRYLCSYQNGTLYAYAIRDEHYEVNTVVYIQVPQSDFDSQKFIIGKQVNTDENEVYNYEFAFEDFVKLNLLCQVEGDFDYRANQARADLIPNEDPDWSVIGYSATLDSADSKNCGTAVIGDKLGISMIVRSELDTWNPSSGNYGLKVKVEGYVKNSAGSESAYKVNEYYFDKYCMYGNVYAFTFPVEQQVVFDISEYATILNVEVEFWQDCQFVDEFNDPVNWRNEGGSLVPYNIHISDVSVYTGYKKGELDGNKLYLYTYDKLIYGSDPQSTVSRSDLDTRSMFTSLIYYNREKGQYMLAQTMEELEDMGAQLYWYVRDESWTADSVTNPIYKDSNNVVHPEWVLDQHSYSGIFWAPISGLSGVNFPTKISVYNENIYGQSSVQFLCDINKSRYQFRVAAVIGSDVILSDILTFTNATDVEGLNSNLAINDTVVLRPAVFLSTADGTKKVLYPDEQFQNFFVYDENNRVLYTKDTREIVYNDEDLVGIDNVKYSDIEYFLELWVKAEVFGLAQETADEHGYVRVSNWKTNGTDQYVPFNITWNLPESSFSMLEFGELGQAHIDEPYYNYRANYPIEWIGDGSVGINTLFDVDKMTTRTFHIRDSFDMTRSHNLVSCTIERNGQIFTAKRNFLFGRATAQGCDYTPVIDIEIPAGNYYLVTSSPFKISCHVIDKYGNEVSDNYTVQWSATGQVPSYEVNETGHYITGTMGSECIPFVLTATVKGLVNWDLHVRRGMLVTNSPTFLVQNTVFCPSRIEFNSTGQAPRYATQAFECRKIGESEAERQFFYPTWHLYAPSNNYADYLHLIADPVYLIKYYLVPLNAGYDSTKSYSYVDIDMCWHMLDRQDPNVGSIFNEYKSKNILFEARSETYARYYGSSADSANGSITTETAPIEYTYRLTYDAGGVDAVQGAEGTAWQWHDEYATSNAFFTWLGFDWNTSNGMVHVAQAIAYDRTYYPSSLVNEWDGKTLSLDEENGAILATMIAAGTKDHANRFTGVMMGNWTQHGDSSFDSDNTRSNSSGIYGVNAGEFSFAFLDDGTGYIGPSGKGRIQFDGKNALISNSDRTCYLNLNPNTIFETGQDYGINWYDTSSRGISQYFLYCKVPVDANRLIHSTTERNLEWANDFLDDDDNNYFIVDPAHGAMMSGGIVSKYGRIGNWYINSTGLYQKYINVEDSYDAQGNFIGSSKNRFIYLGMPGISKTALDNEWNKWEQKLAQNETARQNRINNTGETDMSQTETLLRDLYEYMNKSLMSIDVYHYYTSSLALQMFIDYLQPFIDKYNIGYYISPEAMVSDIYDVENLVNSVFGIYRYNNINQYLHNHYLTSATTRNGVTYPKGTRTKGSYGLQPNIWKVMGYVNRSFTCNQITYVNPNDILYRYYENDSSINKSNTYYTVNQIGDIRIYSYDPQAFDTAIRSQISNLVIATSSSDLTLQHLKTSQSEMNGHWWEPTVHPDDTNGSIKNQFWNSSNNTWNSVYNPSQTYLNANSINYPGLMQWIETTKIYLYYAQQQYNQVLYRQLETGLDDLNTHKNDSAAAMEKYETAMAIVQSYGGLQAIKNLGLSNAVNESEEFEKTLTEEQKARLEKLKLAAINEEFDDKAAEIKKQRAEAIRNLYCKEDSQKYAIYAGHNSPFDLPASSQGWLNPLFGVKWNGYMIARYGKIGKDSPWFVSDVGLTQKNNFGTIFLGNPDTSGMPVTPNEYARSVNGDSINFFMDEDNEPIYTNNLLPNLGYVYIDSDNDYNNYGVLTIYFSKEDFIKAHPNISSYQVNNYRHLLRDIDSSYGYSAIKSWARIWYDETSSNYKINFYNVILNKIGQEAILANDQLQDYDGNTYNRIQTILSKRGPRAYNEYGAYSIYAGDTLEINFGVRFDGTLFSKRGSIGGWRIESSQLVNYVNDIPVNRFDDNEGIALDADNHQIRLHGSDIVIDGTSGIIFMGKPATDGVTYSTNSHLIMSNINITSQTVGVTSYQATAAGSAAFIQVDTQDDTKGHDWAYSDLLSAITYGDGGGSVDPGSASSNTIRGTTVVKEITTTSAAISDNTINYNQGYYTICYNQTDPQGVPGNIPTIAGSGGVGIAFSSSGKVAFYPFVDDSQLGFTLNSIKYRWNIYASYVTASAVYIEDSLGNRDPVVTKGPFDSAISALNASISNLADTCDQNAQDTAYALSVAQQALTKANSAIGLAVKEVSVDDVAAAGGFKGMKITVTRMNSQTVESNSFVFTEIHRHQIEDIEVSNGKLKFKIGAVTAAGGQNTASPIIFSSQTATISGASGTQDINIAGNKLTISWDITEALETTFKNGWNEAIAAVNAALNGASVSVSGESEASRSDSISIAVTGGDGKNSLNKTLKISLTNNTVGVLIGPDSSTSSYSIWAIPSYQGHPDAVQYTITSATSCQHKADEEGLATATATIS